MDTNPAVVQAIAERLVQQGAVMMKGGPPVRCHLVGCLRWLDSSRIAWFIAHGDKEDDAFLLNFDGVVLVEDFGVAFLQQGEPAAYLISIGKAQLDDPDDYRIGWGIWKEVAPLHGATIEKAFARLGAIEPEPSSSGRECTSASGARTGRRAMTAA